MIIFYTDPHLGLTRSGNTTPRSAASLQERLFTQSYNICQRDGLKVCLGDMFDTYSNNERVMDRAMPILSKTALTLSGNHDVVNQAGKMGSLEMMNGMFASLTGQGKALFSEFGKPMAFSWPLYEESVHLVAVPHVASQEIFEESLVDAMQIKIDRGHGGAMLLLHCNYDLSSAWATETSLNLTPEMCERLLEKFDYIMLGHEHAPAEYFDGRVIILGNTFPTGLGDVSDKRIAIMEEGHLRFEQIWDASTGYAEFTPATLPERTDANFARLKGEIEPGTMLELTQAINRLWKRSPNLYCLKMEAKVVGLSQDMDDKKVTTSLAQLPDIIRRELTSQPAMLSLWDTLLEEVRTND